MIGIISSITRKRFFKIEDHPLFHKIKKDESYSFKEILTIVYIFNIASQVKNKSILAVELLIILSIAVLGSYSESPIAKIVSSIMYFGFFSNVVLIKFSKAFDDDTWQLIEVIRAASKPQNNK